MCQRKERQENNKPHEEPDRPIFISPSRQLPPLTALSDVASPCQNQNVIDVSRVPTQPGSLQQVQKVPTDLPLPPQTKKGRFAGNQSGCLSFSLPAYLFEKIVCRSMLFYTLSTIKVHIKYAYCVNFSHGFIFDM